MQKESKRLQFKGKVLQVYRQYAEGKQMPIV